jgi:hypothetical protein
MRKRRIVRFLMFFPIAVLVAALVCLLVMSLWNWLMPAIFGVKAITIWQALGLLFLSRLLLGRFHGRPGWPNHWRHRMKERWEQMTPEEREKFRDGLRGRCRGFEPSAEKPAEP